MANPIRGHSPIARRAPANAAEQTHQVEAPPKTASPSVGSDFAKGKGRDDRKLSGDLNAGAETRVKQRFSYGDSAPAAVEFEPAREIKTKVDEASDVVAVGSGFLIVDDLSKKLSWADRNGKVKELDLAKLGKGESGLEGVAYDPAHNHLFVSREEDREILRYEWDPQKGGDPVYEKTFELKGVGHDDNSGVEGLAHLPAKLSPTGEPHLVGVKEKDPAKLVFFDDKGSKRGLEVELPKALFKQLKDFSAVAVDPKTGAIFIGSDESGRVAQLHVEQKGDELVATLVNSFAVRDDDGEKLERIEGLTFNSRGDLFVLTENDGVLHELKRKA